MINIQFQRFFIIKYIYFFSTRRKAYSSIEKGNIGQTIISFWCWVGEEKGDYVLVIYFSICLASLISMLLTPGAGTLSRSRSWVCSSSFTEVYVVVMVGWWPQRWARIETWVRNAHVAW